MANASCSIRIIPRLDIKGPNLVKGVHLEGLRVLGKPEYFAELYYSQGADELLYVDAVASLYGRSSLLDLIERTSSVVFIPLTVAGGLRSLEDIREVLRRGADKVALNTAAVERPELVRQAARTFGSSTIVLSLDYVTKLNGRREVLTHGGRQATGQDPYECAMRAVDDGVGELLLTSIDREGTGMGYDVEFLKRVSDAVPVPVIACGGAGHAEHFLKAVEVGCVDAVSAASAFHYSSLPALHESDPSAEGNLDFMSGARAHRFSPLSIPRLAEAFANVGICSRLSSQPRC